MRKLHRLIAGLLLVSATAVACSDRLDVVNPNSPDRDLALKRPTDVEALISGTFKSIWDALNTNTNIRAGMWNMSLESYANLANWNQVVFGNIPRGPVPNSRGNQAFDVNYQQYKDLYKSARQAAVGLNRVNDPAFTFFPASAAQVLRAKAFANFCIGVSLGYISVAFDSGSVVLPTDDPEAALQRVPYDSINRVALRYLVTADSIAGLAAATSTTGFPLPATWINSPATQSMTAANFQALARGYRALFRANVARSKAEAATVNWDSVIANAAAFYTAFPIAFVVQLQTATPSWTTGSSTIGAQQMHAYGPWHQAWQFMVGMADTSGQYNAWLALPRQSRVAFVVATPDLRFPSGTTRAAQNTSSAVTTAAPDGLPPLAGAGVTPPWYMNRPYFRNRIASGDVPGEPLASSMYDHYRFRPYSATAGLNGTAPYPFITGAELRLLAAEGQLMKSNVPGATPLIDASRTTQGGLPSLVTAGIVNTTTPVPGGTACVPRVPVAPFNASACGNVWEALKWEQRMETAFTSWGNWYFASRRWEDLPQGTTTSWPTPYQELDARGFPLYQLGGLGSFGGQVAVGTYGL